MEDSYTIVSVDIRDGMCHGHTITLALLNAHHECIIIFIKGTKSVLLQPPSLFIFYKFPSHGPSLVMEISYEYLFVDSGSKKEVAIFTTIFYGNGEA